jgi:hypothetical protein
LLGWGRVKLPTPRLSVLKAAIAAIGSSSAYGRARSVKPRLATAFGGGQMYVVGQARKSIKEIPDIINN